MNSKHSLLLVATCLLSFGAHATTWVMNLTGNPLNGSSGNFGTPELPSLSYGLALDGFGINDRFILRAGDSVNATMTFSQDLVVPFGSTRQDFWFNISSPGGSLHLKTFSGTIVFWLDGVIVETATFAESSNAGSQVTASTSFTPPTTARVFDRIEVNYFVSSLSEPLPIERAFVGYSVVGVGLVPEPSSIALLLAGLGLTGFMAKRHRR